MKSAFNIVLLLLASLIALGYGHPGMTRESDESSSEIGPGDGVVLLLPPHRGNFDDISDVDDSASVPWYPFRFESNPFENLFSRMQETLKKIRAEMAASLANQFGQGASGLTPWGKIPEGANTTSTTKIVGDHSVTINETTYTDGNENGGTVIRVRVVDVKPLNETIETVNSSNSSEEEDEEEDVIEPATTSSTTKRPITTETERDESPEELTTTLRPSQPPQSTNSETNEEFDNEIPKSQVETISA